MNADLRTDVPAPGSREFDELLTKLYNACDPNKPARKYYADLSVARGSTALADDVLRRLRRTVPGSYLRCLFSGHTGGGKSSELLHVAGLLQDSSRLVGGRRYFPISIDTDEFLNPDDMGLPDLLLAIAAEIGSALKESPLGIEIVDNYFVDLIRRIQEAFKTELGFEKVEAGVTVPVGKSGFLASLKAIIAPLKRDESARTEVRRALTTQVETIRGEINRVLEKARLQLKQHHYPPGEPPYEDIVLIIDSLDRVRHFGGETDVEKAAYDLFVRNAPTLTDLNAHVTYTIPLRALYAYPGDLQSAYGIAPFTMPMVAVEQRRKPDQEYPAGIACLKAMLAHRMCGYSPDALFDSDALEWLLTMSGGHVRSLMMFAQSAFSLVDELPINLSTAKKATAPTLQLYSRSIHESYYPKMAALHRSDLRNLDTSDEDKANRAMLEQLMVLEYRNGDEQKDENAEPWYAVNPIIRLLGGFKAALATYDRTKAEELAASASKGIV